MKQHHYDVRVTWTGNRGTGTASYKSYGRDHMIAVAGKPPVLGSSDPAFRGDADRYNPEELLVASLAACHMLWYLHLCAVNGIAVTEYEDAARGAMTEKADGSGAFAEVTLYPKVKITDGDEKKALALHDEAHRMCFIANSVNFPVHHSARIEKG